MSRIIVSVSNDLLTDQRVEKVCDVLHTEGHEITLLGRKLLDDRHLDRPYKTKRFRLLFNSGAFFYTELNLRIFLYILFSKADILLANDLDTLLANYYASKFKSLKLVYDSHEYFTEVPELKGRWSRKVWLKIENRIFPKLKNVYTVGAELANIYSKKYEVPVDCIRNVPKAYSTEKEEGEYLFYQGALNEGRGLLELLEAIRKTNLSLKIAGDGDIKNELTREIVILDLMDRVDYLGRLEPNELRKYTQKAAIGFNLLSGDSLNYRYSLANKFFDYIQAGVPQVTMNFPEYASIMKDFKVGVMINDLSSESIQKAIFDIQENEAFYKNEIAKAKKEFVWEKESKKLKAIFAKLA